MTAEHTPKEIRMNIRIALVSSYQPPRFPRRRGPGAERNRTLRRSVTSAPYPAADSVNPAH